MNLHNEKQMQEEFNELDINKDHALDEEEMHIWASPNNLYVVK